MKKFSRRSVSVNDGAEPSEKRRNRADFSVRNRSDGKVTERHRSTEEHILTCAAEIILAVESGRCTLDDILDDDKYREHRRTLSHLLLGCFKYKNTSYK